MEEMISRWWNSWLLRADVGGSLYTGRRRELKCGLFAIQTNFGWAFMGKMPSTNSQYDLVTTTLNLFVKDISISDLWELETIGIKNPSDKLNKEENAVVTRLQTVKVDKNGSSEVQLSWIDGQPPNCNKLQDGSKEVNQYCQQEGFLSNMMTFSQNEKERESSK